MIFLRLVMQPWRFSVQRSTGLPQRQMANISNFECSCCGSLFEPVSTPTVCTSGYCSNDVSCACGVMKMSVNIDPQKPPHEKQRHDGHSDMCEPMARRARSTESEHAGMAAAIVVFRRRPFRGGALPNPLPTPERGTRYGGAGQAAA